MDIGKLGELWDHGDGLGEESKRIPWLVCCSYFVIQSSESSETHWTQTLQLAPFFCFVQGSMWREEKKKNVRSDTQTALLLQRNIRIFCRPTRDTHRAMECLPAPCLNQTNGKRGRGDLLTASQQSPPLATVHQKDLCVFRAITSARRGCLSLNQARRLSYREDSNPMQAK